MFATHESDALKQSAAAGRIELGVHPNFSPGSTHGSDVGSVVDHVFRLVPGANCFRSHSFVDSSAITEEMASRGVLYDSNLCLYLQAELQPLYHWSGIWRLPVFWEDDVHCRRSGEWDFGRFETVFFSPGLKILNVHPFWNALNIGEYSRYASLKEHIPTLNGSRAEILRSSGPGSRTFLIDLIEAVRARGHRFWTLGEIYSSFCDSTNHAGPWTRETNLGAETERSGCGA